MNGHLLPMNRPRLLTMNNGAGEERHEWGNLTTWGTMYARGRVLSLKVEALRAVAQLLAEHLTPKKARQENHIFVWTLSKHSGQNRKSGH